MGLHFEYPRDFDEVWNVHAVGVKKLAFDQWQKLKPTSAEKDRICAYLRKRQKEDRGWNDGKVHHLRTILSQRHWEAENYERIKPQKLASLTHVDFEPTEYKGPPTDAERAMARAALMKTGLLH